MTLLVLIVFLLKSLHPKFPTIIPLAELLGRFYTVGFEFDCLDAQSAYGLMFGCKIGMEHELFVLAWQNDIPHQSAIGFHHRADNHAINFQLFVDLNHGVTIP
jgi:hypothetical protein